MITHLLNRVPYEPIQSEPHVLAQPKRQKAGGYREPDYPFKVIPEHVWGAKSTT